MDDLMNNHVRAVVPWGRILNRLPLPSTMKLKRAQQGLQGLVTRMIAQRRAELASAAAHGEPAGTPRGCPFSDSQASSPSPPPRRDLLSLMISATDEESGRTRVLTDTQLRDQAITLLTAGHETTANALTFTLYLLARHPQEQHQLREEVRQVLGRDDPSPATLDALVRTRWVLSESMRLLPPAWTLGRQNQREVTLGGYTLPPKCTILIPQWTLHRDPRFWSDPLRFLPDRWQTPTHPRFAYIPFSTGPRNCIGESFAWLELMLVLPLLIRDLEFSLPARDGVMEELRLTPAITLRPKDPVTLRCSLAG
jgi:cytochrome P450